MSSPIKKHISYEIPFYQHSLTLDFWGNSSTFSSSNLQQEPPHQLEHQQLQQTYPQKNIFFLRQIHSNKIIDITPNLIQNIDNKNFLHKADASYTNQHDISIVIRVADCIPILFWTKFKKSTYIGGIHAGWKGLKENIIRNTFQTIRKMAPELIPNLYFWIGPHIQKKSYQVNFDFLYNFQHQDIKNCFSKINNKFFFDLKSIAIKQIQNSNININKSWFQPNDSLIDTYTNQQYYSYRESKSLYRNIALLNFNESTIL